ncbi:helix-turn-helix domain-containing protein [Metabacillus fastidiosus]|nr:helix-turn-helix domain-containing protein [Metabacillus fastidiosus]
MFEVNLLFLFIKERSMTVNQICEITNVSKASSYRKLSEGNK